jgi:hypothetical protein
LKLVIQSYGNETEYRRAIFLIYSFLAHNSGALVISGIVIFTDSPAYFSSYLIGVDKVSYQELSPSAITKMRGEINFIHRVKIAIIEEAIQKYDENILYTDTDAFFIGPIDLIVSGLQPGCSFMHKLEYNFDSVKEMPLPAGKTFRAFYNLVTQRNFNLSDGRLIKITPNMNSWNAGVIALRKNDRDKLKDVYRLTDEFYKGSENHASEQFAFSVILQTASNLRACDSTVYHYWYRVKKEIMDSWIIKNLTDEWFLGSLESRLTQVLKWTVELPYILDTHALTIQDHAIQSFNRDEFKQGYRWTVRALFRKPLDFRFFSHVLYHTKRKLLGL